MLKGQRENIFKVIKPKFNHIITRNKDNRENKVLKMGSQNQRNQKLFTKSQQGLGAGTRGQSSCLACEALAHSQHHIIPGALPGVPPPNGSAHQINTQWMTTDFH